MICQMIILIAIGIATNMNNGHIQNERHQQYTSLKLIVHMHICNIEYMNTDSCIKISLFTIF